MSRKLKKATETSVETSAAVATVAPAVDSALMAFTAPKKALAAVLRQLNSIADRKSTMPALGQIAISTSKTGVVLAATDLNVWGIVTCPGWHVHGTGSLTVNAKALSDLVRKLPDGDVTVRATSGAIPAVEILQGPALVTLQAMHARDYPKIPSLLPDEPACKQALTTIDSGKLRSLIERVEFAICKDPTRFHLAGVLFEYDGSRARMVATDGHRLALAQCDMDRAGDFATKGVIVPQKACTEIRKLLKDGKCEIGFYGNGEHMLVIRQGGTTLACKLTDAKFPPYEQVIPKDNSRLCTVDRATLLGALGRAKLVTSETRGALLHMVGDTLTISTSKDDTGETKEVLPAEVRPDSVDFKIGLNPNYLIAGVEACESDRVTLAFSTNDKPLKAINGGAPGTCAQLDPILVRATDDAAGFPVMGSPYLCVVMPMRI